LILMLMKICKKIWKRDFFFTDPTEQYCKSSTKTISGQSKF